MEVVVVIVGLVMNLNDSIKYQKNDQIWQLRVEHYLWPSVSLLKNRFWVHALSN